MYIMMVHPSTASCKVSPVCNIFCCTWNVGGMMTGDGEPAATLADCRCCSASVASCAGDGGTPSTWKPTCVLTRDRVIFDVGLELVLVGDQ